MTVRRRTRALWAGASVATGLATAAIPIVAGGLPLHPQVLLSLAAMVALVSALVGWAPGFTIAAIALGTEYALRLAAHHGLDGLAVLESVALFAAMELGLRSLEARSIARPEPRVLWAASWRLVALLVGAAAAAFVVLALASRQLPRAPTTGLAFGLAAAVALLTAAELLRRRVSRAA